MSIVTQYLDTIRSHVMKHEHAKKISLIVEEKTKVQAEYFVVGIVAILIICLFSGFGANLICHLVGAVYPFIQSVRSLEESRGEAAKTQWLIYWVIFSFISILENFIDLIQYFIPFFYPLKLVFTLWLMLPQYKGATVLYNLVLYPLINKNGDNGSGIDEALKKLNPDSIFKAASGKSD
jgi:receptor expression-enhancing protein 5/6